MNLGIRSQFLEQILNLELDIHRELFLRKNIVLSSIAFPQRKYLKESKKLIQLLLRTSPVETLSTSIQQSHYQMNPEEIIRHIQRVQHPRSRSQSLYKLTTDQAPSQIGRGNTVTKSNDEV